MVFSLIVIGTIFQLFLAVLFGVFSIFGVGILGKKLFFIGVVGLPLSCFISAGIIIYNYNTDGLSSVYWWFIMPMILGVLYYALASHYLKLKNKLKNKLK